MTWGDDLQGCMIACDESPGCIDVILDGNTCYFKSSVSTTIYTPGLQSARSLTLQTNVTAAPPARPAPPQCPESDGKVWLGNSGQRYVIRRCDPSRPPSHLLTLQVPYRVRHCQSPMVEYPSWQAALTEILTGLSDGCLWRR